MGSVFIDLEGDVDLRPVGYLKLGGNRREVPCLKIQTLGTQIYQLAFEMWAMRL
jgi:hypothetical protein